MVKNWKFIGSVVSIFGLSLMIAGAKTLLPFIFQNSEEIQKSDEEFFASKTKVLQIIWPSFIMIIGLFAYVFWLGRSFFLFS